MTAAELVVTESARRHSRPGRRALVLYTVFLAAMIVAPIFVDDYAMSVLILIFLTAYLGQAWNIMMGFAGLLSLGHALYIGLGAYISAALFVHYGLSPWIGVLAGMAAATLAGTTIAALSFRFGVTGTYFAILTLAFSELTRLLFDNWSWVGESGGLFLPVESIAHDDLLRLRGSPIMFYYILLALSTAALGLSRFLLYRRIGLFWRAIREDPEAAQALGINVFRYKLIAVAISAAMTAIGGTMIAFYDNNLYPDTAFAVSRSFDLINGPIIGGLGTLFGPVLGSFLLTILGEIMNTISVKTGINGLSEWFYGLMLLIIVALRPSGLWPWLSSRLGLQEAR